MYALEITFADEAAGTETVFVQRPHAIIGASDYAHVVIGDLIDFPFELHLFRGIGRSFRTVPVVVQKHLRVETPEYLEGEFLGEGTFDLGPLKLVVTALDIDLGSVRGEPLDKSAARILRRACERPAPYLPALQVSGETPITLSFSSDLPVLVGRDRECHLRLDAPEVSGKHALISSEGGAYTLEDLGSTNGTYLAGQQVSGKTPLRSGQPIVFGRSVVTYLLEEEAEVRTARDTSEVDLQALPAVQYPMLVSLSEVARPSRLVIREGQSLRIGRDPASDLWLGAPHVSRKHCTIDFLDDENLSLTDLSMNGLAYDGGVLSQGESVQLSNSPCVLNFGGGITVAVCFSEDHEQQFIATAGSPTAFTKVGDGRKHGAGEELETQVADSLALGSYSPGSKSFGAATSTTGTGNNPFSSSQNSSSTSSTGGSMYGSKIVGSARGERRGLMRRFFALRLSQRIAVLLTIFLAGLALALTVKLFLPLFINKF